MPIKDKKNADIVDIDKATHRYTVRDDEGKPLRETTALDAAELKIREGEFLAVLGHNGSGKSTLAKHINALLSPDEGAVFVDGINTDDAEKLLEIRRTAGMVFQNPDNQMIGQIVEEDVAFGPENLGVPAEEIRARVDDALSRVGMLKKRLFSPNKLSGGQKQRVSIAGILAMKPRVLILDEPTAMLDPKGREEVLDAVRGLNKKEGITVVLITHDMDEAALADRIAVMDRGKIVLTGTPKEVFSAPEKLKTLGLSVPLAVAVADILKGKGVRLKDPVPLTSEELINALGF